MPPFVFLLQAFCPQTTRTAGCWQAAQETFTSNTKIAVAVRACFVAHAKCNMLMGAFSHSVLRPVHLLPPLSHACFCRHALSCCRIIRAAPACVYYVYVCVAVYSTHLSTAPPGVLRGEATRPDVVPAQQKDVMYGCDDLSAASRASAGTSRTKMHTAFIPRRTKIRCLPRRLPPKTIIRPGKTRMKVRRCFMRGRTERPGRPTPSGRKGMAGGQGAERASQLLCNVPFASIAPLSTQVISGHK